MAEPEPESEESEESEESDIGMCHLIVIKQIFTYFFLCYLLSARKNHTPTSIEQLYSHQFNFKDVCNRSAIMVCEVKFGTKILHVYSPLDTKVK